MRTGHHAFDPAVITGGEKKLALLAAVCVHGQFEAAIGQDQPGGLIDEPAV